MHEEVSPTVQSRALAISSNDVFANFTHGHALFLKGVGHQRFIDADATVLTVLGFKAAMETLVIVTSVAMAIAG